MGKPILDFEQKTAPHDYKEKIRPLMAEMREYKPIMHEMRTALDLTWAHVAEQIRKAQSQGRPYDKKQVDAINNLEELIKMFEENEKRIKEANEMWEKMEEKAEEWAKVALYYKIVKGSN